MPHCDCRAAAVPGIRRPDGSAQYCRPCTKPNTEAAASLYRIDCVPRITYLYRGGASRLHDRSGPGELAPVTRKHSSQSEASHTHGRAFMLPCHRPRKPALTLCSTDATHFAWDCIDSRCASLAFRQRRPSARTIEFLMLR